MKKMSFHSRRHLAEGFGADKWDSGWKARSSTVILVPSSLQCTLSRRGHSSQPGYQWTHVLRGLPHQCASFYRRNSELLYALGTEVIHVVLLNQILHSQPVRLYDFPWQSFLVMRRNKIRSSECGNEGRWVLPDGQSPRNGNKTKQITTAKIKVVRDVKGNISIEKTLIQRCSREKAKSYLFLYYLRAIFP